ncbi:hypothetical protein [Amycolatopsis sp. NBC_01480]|uniref:hypothetical protein n=1 Tax=Amycolatopsis sp. NBC_01480 TaxID=2903562 RepID=UPI002E29F4C7|nr:hypothetical protein [Amycolatopsis sp. NBC_01480]
MQPTLSAEQAQQRVLSFVHAAAEASFPAGYKLTELPLQPMPCTDDFDHETGQFSLGITYWVDGPDRAHNNTYYENLKKWWVNNDWTVRTDTWLNKKFANASSKDNYLMSLTATTTGKVLGRLSIGASSPCVWPHGTPEPKS